MSRRALLVGINEFQQLDERASISPLYGCENDTELLRAALREHFDFDDSEIEILRGSAATAEGVRAALDRLLSDYDGGGDDVRLFSISTHGTQVEAENPGEEVDDLDEAFVAHDHRWDQPFRDNELKRIFDRVPDDVLLTVLADTCFSGTIQAFVPPGSPRSPKFHRTVSRVTDNPFLRDRRHSRSGRSAASREAVGSAESGSPDFDIVPTPRHVLLSASRADEESSEIMILPGGERQGALSWAFCETLKSRSSRITYRELIAGIGDELNTLPQTPQLECPTELRDALVLAPLGKEPGDQRPPGAQSPDGQPPETQPKEEEDSAMTDKSKDQKDELAKERIALITYLAAFASDPKSYNKKKKRKELMEAAGISKNLARAMQDGDLQKIANVVAPVFKPVRDEGGD